ncbi:hypothetical protein RJ640_005110 [Escallonia rubra]|uniref:non-specific serine/threonine protein kinase n=1 Tax=Escallonia rubra TaxID=112253 RepID=A0AA88RHU8_9ASTE|nr:hypothetical protein RJ640_005110 [Escallonia rubra]
MVVLVLGSHGFCLKFLAVDLRGVSGEKNMKNLLKKLHIGSNQSDDLEGSTSSKGTRAIDVSSPDRLSHSYSHPSSEHNKPFSAISGWLNSVTNRRSPSPPSSSHVTRGERMELPYTVSSTALDAALEAVRCDSASTNLRDPDVEEEYQIQLALELSAREDPEAVQIEAVKQISLGSCPPENTPAEVVAYRYWNYNALGYDDKILDGFYDLYGVLMESTSTKMPSLVDLQGTPVSVNITWEAILVNKVTDTKLLRLEQTALEMAVKSRLVSQHLVVNDLVRQLAALVSSHMGGPVGDPDNMLIAWRSLSYNLKATLRSMVLPLGSLKIGMARHRALLFKVLADSVGLPCRLVKGQQFTGSDDVAMNFVKSNDGREYIVDLMADPGTLIPSDIAGSHKGSDESFFTTSPLSKGVDSFIASSSSGKPSLLGEHTAFRALDMISTPRNLNAAGKEADDGGEHLPSPYSIRNLKAGDGSKKPSDRNTSDVKELDWDLPSRSNYLYAHARSPSWTEGVSSPTARKMKVKDVSQYMIDAAKENPQLAQKLHDVLLESGVVAPPNLFTEIYQEQVNAVTMDFKSSAAGRDENQKMDGVQRTKGQVDSARARFLPPLPYHGVYSKGSPSGQVEHQLDSIGQHASSHSEATPVPYGRNVPVAAAAAAAAAVVASSMVVAAARATTDSSLQVPVAAAATATAAAAAVVATTAAVGKQYENLEIHSPGGAAGFFNALDCGRSDGDADTATYEPRGSGDGEHYALVGNPEGERISDGSTGKDSTRSDVTLDDVADCEIPWEDITLGERIGLGSYGEVYHGDWHGTEVAVKKFLDQAITGESLEEFRSEVQIMRKVRHPNVVLFMGAVTRAPNLSIITEFLPRYARNTYITFLCVGISKNISENLLTYIVKLEEYSVLMDTLSV